MPLRGDAELAATGFNFQNGFGNFGGVYSILTARVGYVALGITAKFRTLVLPWIFAAWFERICSNLLLLWQWLPRRTILAVRFRFEVPEIELVAVNTRSPRTNRPCCRCSLLLNPLRKGRECTMFSLLRSVRDDDATCARGFECVVERIPKMPR